MNELALTEFKLHKNRQRPEQCYSYEKSDGDEKLTIFTMNHGKTFLAEIERKRADGRFYQEFSEICDSVEGCLTVLREETK